MTAPSDSLSLPTPDDVAAAATRLGSSIYRTPVLHSRTLDARARRPLLLKSEHLQRTGSYKARGALNHLLLLQEHGIAGRGVVAASSGNHGQAVAWAASTIGIPATIVVPATITAAKRRAIEAYGAQLEVVGPSSGERLAVAAQLAYDRGWNEVPPYDHPWTIAGQGTWLAEALTDVDSLPEMIIVPVSGGGLAAGTILAAVESRFEGEVVGVEPAGADDTRQSLEAGRRVSIDAPDTIADALCATQPGALTFAINRTGLAGIVTVEDDEIVAAMRLLLERAKQLVEPGGAAALAAALSGQLPGTGPALVLLSGGNIGVDALAALVAAPTPAAR